MDPYRASCPKQLRQFRHLAPNRPAMLRWGQAENDTTKIVISSVGEKLVNVKNH